LVGRQRFETQTNNGYLIEQADLRAAFTTAFLEHALSAGVELARETRDQSRDNLQIPGAGGPNLQADLFNPDPTPDVSALARVFSSSSQTDQTTFALYASDQAKLTSWLELLVALRFDLFRTDYETETATVPLRSLSLTDRLFNWRAGLVVHPLETISVYAMGGTSANPSAEVGVVASGTESLKPELSRSVEVGAKAELLKGRLGLGGSVFRVDKTDARVPNTDPLGPPQILAGRQMVDGVSLGLSGNVLDRWRAFLSYTLMRSAILEHTNAYLIGQSLPNVPRHSGSLWTTCEVMDDLTVGGGVAYQSETAVNNPASEAVAFNRVPRYWRLDAFARYAFGVSEIQLNVNNLTDALYYEQLAPNRAVPADGLSANLTLRVRF
jgi:catecholate siderophore receptor